MSRRQLQGVFLLLACVGLARVYAQDPALALSHNYKLILDTPDVAVLRVHYGAHEFIGPHTHPAFPTVYVYLNDGSAISFRHEGKEPTALTRPPTHAGAFRVSPGRLEHHSIQNLGSRSDEFVRIEFKRLPAHEIPMEFHSQPPMRPLTPGVSVPYKGSGVAVERIICMEKPACVIPPEPTPSVLVVIPTDERVTASHHLKVTADNPVVWLPANTMTTIKPHGPEPIDVVRVDLLKP